MANTIKGPEKFQFRIGPRRKTGYLTQDNCVLDEEFKLVGTVSFDKRWSGHPDAEAFNDRPPAVKGNFINKGDAARWLLEAQAARLGV